MDAFQTAISGGPAMSTNPSAPPKKNGDPQAPDLSMNSLTANPFRSALANSIANLSSQNFNTDYTPTAYQGFQTYTPGADFQETAYQAKDYSNATMPGYDSLRSRLNAQYAQSADQAQDTLNRQFAAMGGGPSGALAKQTENLATGMAAKKSQDLSNISFQEEQQRQAMNQAEQQKAFQSQEAAKGRQFQAHQMGEQEKYGAFQTRQQQSFADFQRQAQEQFQNVQANAQRALQQAGMQIDGSSKLAGLDQQWAQQQIDARVQEYNAELSAYTAKHTGGLFGSGGFLGLGI